MCEREREVGREVLKMVGEQEDVRPIISIQGCEVSRGLLSGDPDFLDGAALDGVHRSTLECGHSPRLPRQIEVLGHWCVVLVLYSEPVSVHRLVQMTSGLPPPPPPTYTALHAMQLIR